MVVYDQLVSPELERKIRNYLDDKLPYKALHSLAIELAAIFELEADVPEILTALGSLEKRKIYKLSYSGTAITSVCKGSEFKELIADANNRPRSVYGKVLGELRRLALDGVCRQKRPAAYLSGRIDGLSTAEAEEVLCRLHEAAIISVFQRDNGDADILVGSQTEVIDLEVQELISDEPGSGIASGSIYALLERLLVNCETAEDALDKLRGQAAEDASLAAAQAGRITDLEAMQKELQAANGELTQKQYPTNRLRKLARRAGLLE